MERIVGSVGRYGEFDGPFLPTRARLAARWKRIDRASNRDEELPPVSLYKLGYSYGVEDRNRRVSVTHYQGMEMIDAEIVEPTPGYPRPSPRTPALKGVSCLWSKGPQRRRRGGDARPIFPDASPGDEKNKGVVRAVAWVTLGLSVLMTLLSVVLPL